MRTTLSPPPSAVSIPHDARPLPGPRLTPAGRRLVGVALFVGMLIAAIAGLQPAGLYVLGVLVYMPLERLFKRHQQDILRSEYRTDLLHLFLTPVLAIIIGIIPLIIVLVALSPIPTLENVVASQPRWLQFFEVLVIGDLAGYWLHRAQHEVGFLWRFHKIHHSVRTMDWLAGARSHPGGIISTVAIAIVPAYLVGFDTAVLGAFGAIQGLWAVLYHANVRWRMRPLDGVVATPEFHHWHHSREAAAINRNYAGLFPAWDIMFGSYYMPKDLRPTEYGVNEDVPSGWWAQMKYPLKHS
jgi:sterol desaturase/sphingolipid hydroxylase (fatty acid hydroxylase superfamily)